ncbi:CoA transferase [Corynebacterium sp. HMSC27B11]|uniref:CoA transferase n=1 Tax=Corynebacterium sp. HMSC27B11 TaxID=1581065 RepID=UPI0008A5AF4D|nr:CoA transferase [Corynebacterium sp. HMSC27B11]OFS17678.1 2-methylacyl-CoA racemase [Corynebacterium sp. HMSC27B11]
MPLPVPPTVLRGVNVLSLAPNLPGPIAARRLAEMGAKVTKIEGPTGDLMAQAAPKYYEWLCTGQDVVQLNLKEEADRGTLHELLSTCDVLITSSRPAALARLGLAWEELHAAYPRLCQVAIVGHSGDDADLAGHDLTYQAHAGTLLPPAMPTVPVADLAGAELAVQAALALLLGRNAGEDSAGLGAGGQGAESQGAEERGNGAAGGGGYHEVALADAAEAFAMPAQFGLSAPGGLLGGALPGYRIYEAAPAGGAGAGADEPVGGAAEGAVMEGAEAEDAGAEGAAPTRVAFAALEPHFMARAMQLLGVDGTEEQFAAVFKTKTAAEWEAWGIEQDVPIAEIRGAGRARN